MSKSECEALSFYQQCFSNYYLYKMPYEWDIQRKLVVKVTRLWEVWIHRIHFPAVLAVTGILTSLYVIQHKRLFPSQSELTDLAEVLIYLVVVTCFAYIPLYEELFQIYDGDVFPAINRLLVFNRNIRKCSANIV
jgi:hypothetical protein